MPLKWPLERNITLATSFALVLLYYPPYELYPNTRYKDRRGD